MAIMTFMTRVVRSSKGQSLVELTLILPIMLLLVYGAVEVGNVISTYATLSQLTREGANLTSRATAPDVALDGTIAAASPTIRSNNLSQWRVIYSRIIQDPEVPCPPTPCTYKVDSQIARGDFDQMSRLGEEGSTVTETQLPGINNVAPNQVFHALEAFYDYTPNVMSLVGNNINRTFYERSIFTNVSGI